MFESRIETNKTGEEKTMLRKNQKYVLLVTVLFTIASLVAACGSHMERLREAHRRQSEEIEKAEVFINRFRYTATKAKQVQSRIKLLDKVERIEIPKERKKIRFKFPESPRPGRVHAIVTPHVAQAAHRGERCGQATVPDHPAGSRFCHLLQHRDWWIVECPLALRASPMGEPEQFPHQ